MNLSYNRHDSESTAARSGGPRPLILFVSGLLIILLFYYMPWLQGKASFFLGDHDLFFEPLCRYIGSRLKQGNIPFWNPLMGTGQSQVAIASPSLFYPLNFLVYFLDYNQGVAVLMILHQMLAGLGSFLLVQRLKWGVLPAMVAASIMGLSGYMFSLSQNFTLVSTAAWLPLLGFSVLILGSTSVKERIAGCLLTVISIYMMMAAGRPEIWAVSLAVLLVLCLIILAGKFNDLQELKRIFFLLAGTILAAFLISMPVVIPPAEWALQSPRTIASMNNDVFSWSGNWYDFLSIVLGQPLGSAFDISNPFVSLFEFMERYLPFVADNFMGPVAITLAFCSMADRSFRLRWLSLFGLIAAVVVTLGKNTPIMPFLVEHLPQLGFLRIPIKFMFFVQVAVSLMAARGLVSFSNPRDCKCSRLLIGMTILWFASALLGLGLVLCPELDWFGLHQYFLTRVHEYARAGLSQLGVYLSSWSLVGFVTCVLLVLSIKQKSKRSLFVKAVAFLVPISLTISAAIGHTAGFSDPQFYDHRSYAADVVNAASKGGVTPPRLLSITIAYPDPPSGYHARNQSSNLNAVEQYGRQILIRNTNLDFGVDELFPYEGSLTRESRFLEGNFYGLLKLHAISELSLARMCQASATDFLISQIDQVEPMPAPSERYFEIIGEFKPLNVRVYATRNPLPFAYYSSRFVFMPVDKAIEAMVCAERSGFDPGKEVILSPAYARDLNEVPMTQALAIKSSGPDQGVDITPVKLSSFVPERLEMQLHPVKPGVLVVNDGIYPGWKVMVDGKDAKLLRANGLFKAVMLEPGEHRVRFVFEPQSLKLGLVLAGLGLAWLWLLLFETGKEEQS